MNKYKVTMGKTIWIEVTVEAADEEAAWEHAEKIVRQRGKLCLHCTHPYGASHTIDDADDWQEPSQLGRKDPDVELISEASDE